MLKLSLKLLITLLLVSMLAACGFHLRATDSPLLAPLTRQQVLVQGVDSKQGFGQKLITALEQAGAEPTTEAKKATLRLTITHLEESKTATAFSATRQVREFNHFLDVRFTVESMVQAGQSLASSVQVERNQIYNSRYVLGVSEEERSIQAELQLEAARLLALRLAALIP